MEIEDILIYESFLFKPPDGKEKLIGNYVRGKRINSSHPKEFNLQSNRIIQKVADNEKIFKEIAKKSS